MGDKQHDPEKDRIFVRALEGKYSLNDELKPFDTVVFDPPREGAAAQAQALAASSVPRVIAVSCNPSTFARDARILRDGGYEIAQVTPVDQFLFSTHVEVVGRFDKPRRLTRGRRF